MASAGGAALATPPGTRRSSSGPSHFPHGGAQGSPGGGGNAFDVLSRAGPSITMANLQISTAQTLGVITAAAPELDSLPDHLVENILEMVLRPIRAVNSGLRADEAVRAWAALSAVSKRWRALVSDEPMRLRIDGGRWPAILAWLEKTRLRISALELHLPLAKEHVTASEAMGDLLSDARFQQRNAGCLQDLSVHFGLDAPALPLRGGRQPFVWRALRSLSLLRVDRHTVAALKQLPGGLRALQLEGAACHRHEPEELRLLPLGDALAHLGRLRALTLTRVHISPADLPKGLQRLQVCYCTLALDEKWPAGLSVRWEGPMHQRGVRTMLLVHDRDQQPDAALRWQY